MSRIKAYSKVNLSLRVFTKRSGESLHRIDSIVVLYRPFFDEIDICLAPKDKVVFVGMEVPDSNTVAKALSAFKQRFSIGDSFQVTVHKNIPIGSGLGGGSSDAAVVLCWLAQKYRVSERLLLPLALQIGSDVPFFVSGHECARVTGFGGSVKPVACDWKVKEVITSDVVSLSKDVYKEFDKNVRAFDRRMTISAFLSGYCGPFNDLQPAFLSLHPAFVVTMDALAEKSKNVLVSGSGSSLVVLIKQ